MDSRDEKHEEAKKAIAAYKDRYHHYPICGFPQFESYDELIAAIEESLESGIRIEPIYPEGLIF